MRSSDERRFTGPYVNFLHGCPILRSCDLGDTIRAVANLRRRAVCARTPEPRSHSRGLHLGFQARQSRHEGRQAQRDASAGRPPLATARQFLDCAKEVVWNIGFAKERRSRHEQCLHTVSQGLSRGIDHLQGLAHLDRFASEAEAIGAVVAEIDIGEQDIEVLVGAKECQGLRSIGRRLRLVSASDSMESARTKTCGSSSTTITRVIAAPAASCSPSTREGFVWFRCAPGLMLMRASGSKRPRRTDEHDPTRLRVPRSSAALNEPATAAAGRASKTAISPIGAAEQIVGYKEQSKPY